jgi:hypothetical protein
MNFFIFMFLSFFMIIGCSQQSMIDHMAPAEDKDRALFYINLLKQKKIDEVNAKIDKSIKNKDTRSALLNMANLIPKESEKSLKVVGADISPGYANITFEYEFENRWLLINVATQKTKDDFSIIGINVNQIDNSLEIINKFTLLGKTFIHYVFLLLAIIFPLLTIYSLFVCAKSKMVKKWKWILFILFGFSQLSINWTTGQLYYKLFALQAFSGSAVAAPYGPFFVSISLPIGAILFLILKNRIIAKQAANNSFQADGSTAA